MKHMSIKDKLYYEKSIMNYCSGMPELCILHRFIDYNKNIVDVGAHDGTLSYYFSKFISPDNKVYPFEPNEECFYDLKKLWTITTKVSYPWFKVALSNVNVEESVLYTPIRKQGNIPALGLSSLHEEWINNFDKSIQDAFEANKIKSTIALRRLDDISVSNIGFIKIDVEGHEMQVLEGAENVLRSNKPVMIVEIFAGDVKGKIETIEEKYNYKSFYYTKSYSVKHALFPGHDFSTMRYMMRKDNATNNIIFLPKENYQEYLDRC